MKKYELIETDFKITVFGIKVFRIKALTRIEGFNINPGELGGYIEKESNLDQYGNAWVYGNAQVYGDARVYGNAWVYGNARVLHRYHCISIENTRWQLTFLPQHIQIGCKIKKIKEWLAEDNNMYGLSPELSDAYKKMIRAVRKVQRLEVEAAGIKGIIKNEQLKSPENIEGKP